MLSFSLQPSYPYACCKIDYPGPVFVRFTLNPNQDVEYGAIVVDLIWILYFSVCEIAKTWKQTFFQTLFCDKNSNKVYFVVNALCGEITVPALPRLTVLTRFFLEKYFKLTKQNDVCHRIWFV